MEDIFIQEIKVNKARNLVDFDIPLSQTERKHLLITGKNGSGKTSLLLEIRTFLNQVIKEQASLYLTVKENLIAEQHQKDILNKTSPFGNNPETEVIEIIKLDSQIIQLNNEIKNKRKWLKQFGGTEVRFNKPFILDEYFQNGDFIIAFFEAKRNTEFKIPTGINKVSIKPSYVIEEKANIDFIQHIVNLKADRLFAKEDNDVETAKKIDDWFDQFEETLFKLFDTPGMELRFDRNTYNFNIVEDGKEPYNFNQLSDGYSAIFNIVTELIMRMEKNHSKSYDVQGIVLIDEIEAHLHLELQKKTLPFLAAFFPKIQFIVTTHSPFVLSSIENAVICDLEKKTVVQDDLSEYSYSALVESYFDSDKYSLILKGKVKEYEELLNKESLNDDEEDKFFELKDYLENIPKFAADELAVKMHQLRLKELNKKTNHGLPA